VSVIVADRRKVSHSLSDWAELAEMQKMRLATSANSGNSLLLAFQNSSGELCLAWTRIYLAKLLVHHDRMLDCDLLTHAHSW